VDELLAEVAKIDAGIGYATVYRTLKLLVHAGLASVRQFGDGQSRFEVRSKEHHDHLICVECGYVVEFFNEEVEELQELVAREHGFTVERHKHELYGICEEAARGLSCPRRPEREVGGSHVAPPRKLPGPREPQVDLSTEDLPAAFSQYLAKERLKSTRQRDLIVKTFAGTQDHVSVEDLLTQVNRRDPRIGYATVYRTLKLLVRAGLAAERSFGDGHTRYERRGGEHHDHMIDLRSGEILEFHNEEIEELQESIARHHGFRLLRHKHELYGHRASRG
jgi:Fur family ferric uptake transcriptional regulator